MAVLLQIANISKSFGDEVLFTGVSLQVRDGECVGLIAPNGAGKSTLFRIITGQEVPDDGVVAIQREISIGYLTQDAEDENERVLGRQGHLQSDQEHAQAKALEHDGAKALREAAAQRHARKAARNDGCGIDD